MKSLNVTNRRTNSFLLRFRLIVYLILLEYTFLFVVVICDCAKITKNNAIRKLWNSFLFNKACFSLLNGVVLYGNSCLLSFTCFIFSMNCAVLSLSAWRFVPFQQLCTLSSFCHVSLQVFHEVESSCLLFLLLCKYCCLFLTLRCETKEEKKIRKIEFIFQFQAFCNATPVVMHCHLTQTAWLFASEYPLIWCELQGNSMQNTVLLSVILHSDFYWIL